MLISVNFKSIVCLGACLTALAGQVYGALPVVDLGYHLHQAIAFNDTGNYYNFSNIRYAAAPLGHLRFRAPVSPNRNRKIVQTGSEARICPQAAPAWVRGATGWISQYLQGQNITLTQAQVNALNSSVNATSYPAQGPTAHEDCLFLDVMVPKEIFDRRNSTNGAPVMVWIYGGGYTLGSKTGSGNPAGLIERSKTHGRDGIIWIGINYRLGAFGWLGGPTVQSNGVANAGLYDQRFALQWVQNNIHMFGGDPNRVTVYGESAGGGGIMHQITAFGGQQGAPFAQAIMQSPGFRPRTSNYALDNQLKNFLAYANVSTLAEARRLPSAALVAANTQQVWHAPFGQFGYGPSVDGLFVPALPGKLLLQGAYNKDVRVMTGHNLDEGLLFTNPLVQTQEEYKANLKAELLNQAPSSVIDYITEVLYPPQYNGEQNYTDPIARSALVTSELSFTCNTQYFHQAYNGRDYAYYFTVGTGLHGSDIPYTFYNGGAASASVLNTTAALALQDWLVTYARGGTPRTPNVESAPKFVMYGKDATNVELSQKAITYVRDTTANARCAWWQKALYA